MARLKLTRAAIERIKAPDPTGKQRLTWDSELPGFGVLASGTTNAKTYVVQRTLPDGRTRRITVGSVAELTLDAARAEAADLLHAMRQGVDPKAERRTAAQWTLRRALAAYLDSKNGLRPNSVAMYKGHIERHLSDWLDLPLASITAEMIEDRHRAIQREVAVRQAPRHSAHFGSKPGASSANFTMIALRALLNFAGRRDPSLPRDLVRRRLSDEKQWFSEPRRTRLLKADELPAFYRAVCDLPNPIAADYIKLLLFTGLRKAEAAALRWEEIDFAGRVIRIPGARTKSGRPHEFPMTSIVRDLLVARRALGNDHGWVFPGDGRSGHFEEPATAFAAVAKSTEIEASAHDLRRTYATLAEECDVSWSALKRLLNHSQGGDVTSGYTQISIERLRQPAQRVADRIMLLCEIEQPRGANVAAMQK